MENSHSTSYKKDLDKSEVMVGSKYAREKEFDLWADGYDKTVGISDEKQISFCWLQKGTWIHFSDYNEN